MHSSQSSSTFPLKAQWAFPEKASCPKPEDPNKIFEEKSKDEERLKFLDATEISRESDPDADEIPTPQPSIFLPPFSRNQLLCPSYEEYIARQQLEKEFATEITGIYWSEELDEVFLEGITLSPKFKRNKKILSYFSSN